VAVDQTGAVYVAWEAAGENGAPAIAREIKLAKSTDHGGSFSVPGVVTPVNLVGNGADYQGMIRANEYPSLAIGKGSTNAGFLYLVWNDAGATTSDLLSTTGTYGFADVKFTVSKDGGVSWSAPVRINNNIEGGGSPNSDQFEPAIGTDKVGRVGVCFYDRRRDPKNFLIDRYCAVSKDSGLSWSNIKLTPTNYPAVIGQDVLVAPDYMGDYDSVVSDSSNLVAGLLGTYASNTPGNPVVMTRKF
jgi:hypothetical protein